MTPASEPSGFCPLCGYRMNAGVCPECGNTVPQPARTDPHSMRGRVRLWTKRAIFAALIIGASWFVGSYAVYRYWPKQHLMGLAQRGGRLGSLADDILSFRESREMETVLAECKRISAQQIGANEKEWAGCYELWNSGLCLGTDHSFAYYQSTDLGMSSLATGRIVSIESYRIRLHSQFEAGFSNAPIPLEYVRIRWGARHYLVSPEEVASFCAQTRTGYDFGYKRVTDDKFPIYGLPEVPPEFRQYLPPQPHQATVTWVGPASSQPVDKDGQRYTKYEVHVMIDAGLDAGVRKGMEFLSWSQEPFQYIYALDVQDRWSMLSYESSVYDGQDFMLPSMGWKISFRPETAKTRDVTEDNDMDEDN